MPRKRRRWTSAIRSKVALRTLIAQPQKSWVLLACLLTLLLASQAQAQEFPKLTGRVVDAADLLTPEQEQKLSDQSEALEREIGPQYVVVTLTDLQGYAIDDYGMRLGNHWGIGSAERDDGVLLIVAPHERKVRIEVGYGLENRVTDSFAADVLRERVLPHFRAGEFSEGITAGSDAIVRRLRSTAGSEIAAVNGNAA